MLTEKTQIGVVIDACERKGGFITAFKAHIAVVLYKITNFFLFSLERVLWPRRNMKSPKKICIFRTGNVGDIICSIPAFIAIRYAYPNAHITLLTSPGHKGMVGAKELLEHTWFFDRLWVYYSEDIKTPIKIKTLDSPSVRGGQRIKGIRVELF